MAVISGDTYAERVQNGTLGARYDSTAVRSETGYAEITSNVNGIVSTTGVDIAGLTVTVTVSQKPIVIRVGCRAVQNNTLNGGFVLSVTNGDASVSYLSADYLNNPANFRIALHGSRRISLPPGMYTFKARATVVSGTAAITADANTPAYLQVVEV